MSPIAQFNQTSQATQETLEASLEVITRRLNLIGQAMADPLQADHAEISRMGLEKVEALQASSTALFDGAVQITHKTCKYAECEAAHGADLLHNLARTTDLNQAAALQAQWGVQAWTRAWKNGLNLSQTLLGTQAQALSPIHQTVLANAKRLKP